MSLQKLESICSNITSGGTPSRANLNYWEGGTIPWLKTGDIKKNFIYEVDEYITNAGLESSSAKIIPINSLLIAMYGDGNTAGNVAINKIRLATNQACCNLTIDPLLGDYRYVYYYLKGSYDNLTNLKLGGSQQNLNSKTIRNFPIKLPPLEVQQRIAAVLSTYDELIEVNKKRIKVLEDTATELYKEWFVCFRFPNWESTEFDKVIPADWNEVSLGSICKVVMGQSPKSEYYNKDGVGLPFHQGVGTYGERFPINRTYCSISGRTAYENDILFSVRAPVGRLNIANTKMIIGRGLSALSSLDGYNDYLYYLLHYSFNKEDIIGNGAIFNSVTKNELLGFKVFFPSENILKRFDDLANNFNSMIKTLYKKNENLLLQKNDLLSRLMSGKLSVADLDIHYPPSMQTSEEAEEK